MVTDTLLRRAQDDPILFGKLLEVAHLVRPADHLVADPGVTGVLLKEVMGVVMKKLNPRIF